MANLKKNAKKANKATRKVAPKGLIDKDREIQVQLATRIPKKLHGTAKLHCIKNDVSLMTFIVAAITEKLTGKIRKRA